MSKIIFTLLLISFFVQSVQAQELLSENELALKSSLSERRESIPIIDTLTNDLSLFIIDRKNIHFNKFDKEFKVIDQQKFERPKSQIKKFLEKVHPSKEEYLFLLSNDTRKKFELLKINTHQQEIKVIPTSFLSDKEYYLKTFTYKNQICVLTVFRKTSKVNIHKISRDGKAKTLTYDLTSEEFFDKFDKKISLYKSFIVSNNGATRSTFGIEHIKEDIPNALESTSKLVKLYQQKENLILTIDNGHKYTQLITFNLESDSNFEVNNFEKVQLLSASETNKSFTKSNSLISKNRLYQIIGLKGEMKFTVKDLNSKELIKSFSLQKEDSISFKNSPIIQEGGYYVNYREMEKTQKFLRKIAAGNMGISVYHRGNDINVTLGGVQQTSYAYPMMGFGAIGGVMTAVATSMMTPTYYAYASYSSSKSTRIICLFDSNMSHIDGELSPNAFDKIKDFSKEVLNKKAETVFKYNGHYVYGYYESLKKKYFLRKFED